MMKAEVYIARHERHEVIEAYGDCLSIQQKEFLKDNESDFRLIIDYQTKTSELLVIEDEG